MEGFIVVLAFVGLFVLGFPVVLAIGIPCIVYIFAKGLPVDLIAQRTLYALDSFPLVAVPVFLFVGSLMNSAGISRYIYQFADTATGRLPGGLAQVNIFGSLIFAGMSGSALADIGGLGRIEIDAMKKKGFSPAFAAAVTSSSAIVGPIFPPSIPLIIYGTVTGVSVIQLLLGGILPGLLCVAMLMLMTAWLAIRRGYPRSSRWPTLAELWRDFRPAAPAIAAPVILIAGMLMGYFTPTEIASVTVAYAILISGLFYRELTWKGLLDAGFETIRASAGILLIVAVAALFGWILSVEQVPQILTGWMLAISTNPYVLLLIVNFLLLIVGMFLDAPAALILFAPILSTAATSAGIDPVHFGAVMILNLNIGLLTPPVGFCLFAAERIAGCGMPALVRAITPFLGANLIALGLLSAFPPIALWLPRVLGF